MANRIMNECLTAMENITQANTFPISKEFIHFRQEKQYEAKGHLETMEFLLDIAYNDVSFHIKSGELECWITFIENTIKRLNAWMKSDKERVKQQ